MMMLLSVLAAAGPRPGGGDVSAMCPTVDYGAHSIMFRFGPNGVAGFNALVAAKLPARFLCRGRKSGVYHEWGIGLACHNGTSYTKNGSDDVNVAN